jgi:hypothetical protein
MAFLHKRLKKQLDSNALLLEFFNARGSELQRTPLGMLRPLLNQLYLQDEHVRGALRKAYQEKCNTFGRDILESSDRLWSWQEQDLQDLLQQFITQSPQLRALTIFVDALDEDDIVAFIHDSLQYDRQWS